MKKLMNVVLMVAVAGLLIGTAMAQSSTTAPPTQQSSPPQAAPPSGGTAGHGGPACMIPAIRVSTKWTGAWSGHRMPSRMAFGRAR